MLLGGWQLPLLESKCPAFVVPASITSCWHDAGGDASAEQAALLHLHCIVGMYNSSEPQPMHRVERMSGMQRTVNSVHLTAQRVLHLRLTAISIAFPAIQQQLPIRCCLLSWWHRLALTSAHTRG
jgi:hypothetical protein